MKNHLCFFFCLLASVPGRSEDVNARFTKASDAPIRNDRLVFDHGEYSLFLQVTYLAPFVGEPLRFIHPSNQTDASCYTETGAPGKCVDRFVGSAAIVHIEVKHRHTGRLVSVELRERVSVLSQHAVLSVRPPFERSIRLIKGLGSDIQAFGYDEALVSEDERAELREKSADIWRICRQELYLASEATPTAVIDWERTPSHISILRVSSLYLRQTVARHQHR